MDALFLQLLNMSITASWLVLAVLLVRLIFKKAPKAVMCALWAVVAVRLICPFSFESMLSLIPSAEPIPQEILYVPMPAIDSGIPAVNEAINPILSETLSPNLGDSVNPMQVVTLVAANVWILGVIAMLIYAVVSYIRVWRKVRVRLPLQDRVYECDGIDTPFIFGIIKPQIYLPSTLSESDRAHVLAHERAHLKRLDHVWKPLGFALLTVYWFNPLLWVAYILLCRDIELACDERVIRDMDKDDTAAYTEALLHCSTKQRFVTACPLAFGESGVKARIKNVLNYKKPAFWIVLLAVLACIAVTVCFLTNPLTSDNPDSAGGGSELEGVSVSVKELDLTSEKPTITILWHNDTLRELMYGESFRLYRLEDGREIDTNLIKNSGFNAIGYLLTPYKGVYKTYDLSQYNLSENGTYRFESTVSIHGGDATSYKVWVDFAINDGALSLPLTPATDSYTIEDATLPDTKDNVKVVYPALKSETKDYEILNSFLEDNLEEKLYYLQKAYGKTNTIDLHYTITYNDGTLISVLFEGTVTLPSGETVGIAFTACLAPGNSYTVKPASLFTIDEAFVETFREKWLALWDDATLTAEKAQEIRNTIHAYSDDELAALLRSGAIADFGFTSNGILVVFHGKPTIADYVLIEIPYATATETTTTTTAPVIETRVNTDILSQIGKTFSEITASLGELVLTYNGFEGGFATCCFENSNGFYSFGMAIDWNYEEDGPIPKNENGIWIAETAPHPLPDAPCLGIHNILVKDIFLGLSEAITAEQLADMYGLEYTGSAPADRSMSGQNTCVFDFEGFHFYVYAEDDFTIGPGSIIGLIKMKDSASSATTTTSTTATTTTTTTATTTAMTSTTRATTTAPTAITTTTTVATATTTTTREYYTVVFEYRGRELSNQYLRVGESIKVPDPIDETSYIWDHAVPATMPAEDLHFELTGVQHDRWYCDMDGTLTVTGNQSNHMPDYPLSWERYLSEIETVRFTNNVYSIGEYAFYNMPSLKRVVFSDTVNSIGKYAFAQCTKLTTISFGKSLKFIGEKAFFNANPQSITFNGYTRWYAVSKGYFTPIDFTNDPVNNASVFQNYLDFKFTIENPSPEYG